MEINFKNDVLCRVCLSQGDEMQALFEGNSIIEQIEYCTGLLLSPEPSLPAHICRPCVSNLHTAHSFKTTCVASQHTLYSLPPHLTEAAQTTLDSHVPNTISIKVEREEAQDMDEVIDTDWVNGEAKKRKRVKMKKEKEDRKSKKVQDSQTTNLNSNNFPGKAFAGIGDVRTEATNSEEFVAKIPGALFLAEKSPRKRAKKGSADSSKWEINRIRRARETGRPYFSQKRLKGVRVGFETRKGRTMGPPCMSDLCKRSFKRKCKDITDEHRKYCFDKFWSELNWAEKKVYINDLVEITSCRKANAASRRTKTVKYTLEINNQCWPVCKTMFLNTLSIGEKTVLGWIEKAHS